MRRRGLTPTLLVLLIFLTSPPQTRAQEPAEKSPEKCAFLNLANSYLKCAWMHEQVLVLSKDADTKRLSKKARGAFGINQKARDELRSEFLIAASRLYLAAGKKITANDISIRGKLSAEEMKSFSDELVRIADEKKFVEGHPSTMYGQCGRTLMGEDVFDDAKLNIRLNMFLREARETLLKAGSCMK